MCIFKKISAIRCYCVFQGFFFTWNFFCDIKLWWFLVRIYETKMKTERKKFDWKVFFIIMILAFDGFLSQTGMRPNRQTQSKMVENRYFALNKENRLNQISNPQNVPYAWERRCSVIASENNKSCFIVEINLWMTSHSNIIANVVRIFIFFSSLSVRVSIKLYTFLTHFDLLQQQK